ncbi:hypothetical protein QBC40DRAFT_300381 [Triangularia verruculosa]|uniref:Uncharacterized protein n=1 Tax=Triangularia verruculosa TaxID=2587418 RepID=A0AAN6X920_9PEZI|nr:hypothetical protein QBC40DRAFT_300381 [Triangularia verruculosa]
MSDSIEALRTLRALHLGIPLVRRYSLVSTAGRGLCWQPAFHLNDLLFCRSACPNSGARDVVSVLGHLSSIATSSWDGWKRWRSIGVRANYCSSLGSVAFAVPSRLAQISTTDLLLDHGGNGVQDHRLLQLVLDRCSSKSMLSANNCIPVVPQTKDNAPHSLKSILLVKPRHDLGEQYREPAISRIRFMAHREHASRCKEPNFDRLRLPYFANISGGTELSTVVIVCRSSAVVLFSDELSRPWLKHPEPLQQTAVETMQRVA